MTIKKLIAVLFSAVFALIAHSQASPTQHINPQVSQAAKVSEVRKVRLLETTPVGEKEAVVTPQPILTQNQQWMKDAGIAESDWPNVDFILSHESGWCVHKWEGQTGYCPDEYAECQPPVFPDTLSKLFVGMSEATRDTQ